MSSTLMESAGEKETAFMLDPTAGKRMLTYWPNLSLAEKAFAIAYIEGSYSVHNAVVALGITRKQADEMFRNQAVKRAISEIQSELDGIDFLNEKWVKAQLLRIFPMAMGDEAVPMVTNTGEEVFAKKFYPDIAMRVVEYVAPKKTAPAINVNINNINKLTDAQLEEIALAGNTYDHVNG